MSQGLSLRTTVLIALVAFNVAFAVLWLLGGGAGGSAEPAATARASVPAPTPAVPRSAAATPRVNLATAVKVPVLREPRKRRVRQAARARVPIRPVPAQPIVTPSPHRHTGATAPVETPAPVPAAAPHYAPPAPRPARPAPAPAPAAPKPVPPSGGFDTSGSAGQFDTSGQP
jgi:hypothetical protein